VSVFHRSKPPNVKRLRSAVASSNVKNQARLTAPAPETDTDRLFATTGAEIQIYEKLKDFSGESLVRRLSKKVILSANKQYEVDQFSVELVWNTPDTATASLYICLEEQGDVASGLESGQVSAAVSELRRDDTDATPSTSPMVRLRCPLLIDSYL
jgi:hypothetical protein